MQTKPHETHPLTDAEINARSGKTWDQVEVTFQPKGEKCTVMVAHGRIQTRAQADGLREVWGGALESLKALLEKP